MIELAGKVDYDSLLLASLSLLRIAEPGFARGLKRDFVRSGIDLARAEVMTRKTPFGEIVIGGTTDDWHKDFGSRDIAVLIDLGGNDVYADGAGASTRKLHASIVVDLEGDDTYAANTDFAQGAGFLGVGILADLGGDDSYVGQTGAQGASFAGVGLLLDSSGDDVYRAQALAQGASFWGLAGLIDLSEGDDRYESHLLSQGVGIAGGIGALLDAAGDDQYYATGLYGSEYGTPGTFQQACPRAWASGCGEWPSGGLGILYDGQGKDRFRGRGLRARGRLLFRLGDLQERWPRGRRLPGLALQPGVCRSLRGRHLYRARRQRHLQVSEWRRQRPVDGSEHGLVRRPGWRRSSRGQGFFAGIVRPQLADRL